MNLTKENWRALDINVDSLWIIGPRAKSGKRSNIYHGNFAPQIPNQMIQRYTEEGDVVIDMFMGSGTTLYECETLNRNFIGFDINDDIIQFVKEQMVGSEKIRYFIHNCDDADSCKVSEYLTDDLKVLGKSKADHIIIHAPYLDIIKFTDKPADLSQISDVTQFLDNFILCLTNFWSFLKDRKYVSVVIGDIYRNGEVVPLGFYMMNAIKQNFKCKLKGIVVKDIVGNRAKIGQEALWKYRALRNGNYLFKHEYLFVFQKMGR